MKWIILGLLFISCSEKITINPTEPLSVDHNSVTMTIGDSWLYKRTFINIPESGIITFPDSIISYSFFSATKDTTIDNKSYLIIDGKDYEVTKDSIKLYRKRCAIHLGDTILMYEFNTGDIGFMSGVMKQKSTDLKLNQNNISTLTLKRHFLLKLLSKSFYDTTVYSDFVYPMIFPICNDSIYLYRGTGDAHGNLTYRRIFLGIESISTATGTFQSYKWQWLSKEALNIDSIYFCDWIGKNGLLKRYADCGRSTIADSLGSTTAIVKSWDIMELVGHKDIDSDTLKPWGRN